MSRKTLAAGVWLFGVASTFADLLDIGALASLRGDQSAKVAHP